MGQISLYIQILMLWDESGQLVQISLCDRILFSRAVRIYIDAAILLDGYYILLRISETSVGTKREVPCISMIKHCIIVIKRVDFNTFEIMDICYLEVCDTREVTCIVRVISN